MDKKDSRLAVGRFVAVQGINKKAPGSFKPEAKYQINLYKYLFLCSLLGLSE